MNNTVLQRLLNDDTVLQEVNSRCISLQRQEVKRNNEYLQLIIPFLIKKMKSVDSLFEKTYVTMNFSGSFYKKTKIDKPDEFDLDLVIKLPYQKHVITETTKMGNNEVPPGYTLLRVANDEYTRSQYTSQEQKRLSSFIRNGYLTHKEFRAWIESIIETTLRKFPSVNGNTYIIRLPENNDAVYKLIKVSVSKSGPAFTLRITVPNGEVISIDFVPAVQFSTRIQNENIEHRLEEYQTKYGHRTTWLAIPKPIYWFSFDGPRDIYWRFSLYDQEKDILSKFGRIKLLIRFMKKLRNTEKWHQLASYYIETLFLNEINDPDGLQRDLDGLPLTRLFYMMLHKLMYACENHNLPYYWDPDCNMLANVNRGETFRIWHRLNNIILNIERKLADDTYIIARYILTEEEFATLFICKIVDKVETAVQRNCIIS